MAAGLSLDALQESYSTWVSMSSSLGEGEASPYKFAVLKSLDQSPLGFTITRGE